MRKYRTAELARLAEANGFTASECHRAMLEGASLLLREMANGRYSLCSGWTLEERGTVEKLAAAIEDIQKKITFLEVP